VRSTYIYLITNINNNPNRVYIGKTINLISRKYNHFQTFGNHIQIDVIDNVKSLKSKDWKPLECYWIEQFKSWGFEVQNKNNGGGGSEFRTQESKNSISKTLRKPIIQYDLKGNIIKEFSSLKEAKLQFGGHIDRCLKGKGKKAGGYFWGYKNGNLPQLNLSSRKGKTVSQYNLNGDLINIFPSTQEAERVFNNSLKDNIGACCRNTQKTAYGYKWEYN
jgi:hypothetical protein